MRFQCPGCKEIVAVDNSEMGAKVQCGRCQQIVAVPESRTALGSVIADFIIQKELGRGGMGIVYLSHQISLDRSAALKVLSETYAKNTEFVVSFIKEARAAAKLNHPHIVQAYAVGEDDGIYYFAMENVNGETMKDILDRNKVVAVDQAVQIIQQIAEALDYAWKEERLIHRDIKPDNIMLTNNGKAKLADLGLARRAGEKDNLDNGDEVMGTPQYISPEHLIGDEMDIRSDIYSLGATFYHFVTGQFPFNGNSVTEIAKKHITDPLVPPNKIRASIPAAVSDVIVKMMEKDPNNRYQDAEELVETLRDIRKNKLSAPQSSSRPVPRLNLNIPGAAPQTPKLNLNVQTSTPAPKLNLNTSTPSSESAPNAPSISVKPVTPLQPQPTPPPAEEKKTEDAKEEEGAVSREMDTMQANREKKARLKVILLILGIVAVLAALGGGTFYFLRSESGSKLISSMKSKSSATKNQNDAEQAALEQEPQNTALTMKATEILKFAQENPDDSAKIAALCEEFLENFKQPKYEIEKTKSNEIKQLFEKADEANLAAKRAEAHEAAEKKREEERIAQQQRDKERREQQAREAERRKQEAERKRKEAERKRKETNELNALRKKVQGGTTWTRIQLVDKISAGDYVGAKKILQNIINISKTANGKSQQYRNEANKYANWGRKMLGMVNSAEKMANTLKNAGSEINRPQVVYKREFGYVTGIKDGVLTVDKGGGKTFEVAFDDLSNAEQMRFVGRIANRAKRNKDAFNYLLFNGEFVLAEEFAENNDQKNEWKLIGTDYIRSKYRSGNPDKKNAMKRKYGNLSYFNQAAGIK